MPPSKATNGSVGGEGQPKSTLNAAASDDGHLITKQGLVAAIEELKIRGNEKFREGLLEDASDLYTQGIGRLNTGAAASRATSELRAALFTNRALCHFKRRTWVSVVNDTTEALRVDPGREKALCFRARAEAAMGHQDAAQRDVLAMEARNPASKLARITRKALGMPVLEKSEDSTSKGKSGTKTKVAFDKELIRTSPRAEFEARRTLERTGVANRDISRSGSLGSGNYSEVFLVTHRPSGIKFALKVLDRTRLRRLKMRHPHVFDEVLQEKKALLRLRGGVNIVRLVATYSSGIHLNYLLEFRAGGCELWELLVEKRRILIGSFQDELHLRNKNAFKAKGPAQAMGGPEAEMIQVCLLICLCSLPFPLLFFVSFLSLFYASFLDRCF